MTLVYLDTETTGLNIDLHHAWEVAWAVDDGPIHTALLPHTLDNATDDALRICRYHHRVAALQPNPDLIDVLRSDLTGATIVGANPAFDMRFLRKTFNGAEPWHYRSIDVSTGVMWLAGWDKPRGLLGATYEMRNRGHQIPMPDHTAAGDVATVRALHRRLRFLLHRTSA
ncbi:MAG: hypothetical protein F2667_06805 [Actinobacteria bacterium]|nr:hypothetical protein [Actinomycetota bacterium]